ncbi:MAG: hypothetical protein COB85_03240 [Bacteroidetes bacterium]|nr:MAG: hypothetical protein COB85_03240 [Bacteroidota bacterium]
MRLPLFVILLLFAMQPSYSSEIPLAQKGEMSLAEWDYKSDPLIDLTGDWVFYWQEFVDPAQADALAPTFYAPASRWNDYNIEGKTFPSHGYASYRVTLHDLPDLPLTLVTSPMPTAYRVYINEELACEVGHVGTDKESMEPMSREVVIDLPDGVKEIRVTIHVSNFYHRKGGFNRPFKLGVRKAVRDYTRSYTVLGVWQFGALGVIGLFFLVLYTFRRKDSYILYFAIFCIALSLRPVISVHYLIAAWIPDINWHLMVKLEYLSMFMGSLFFTLFIKSLFPEQFPNWIVKLLACVLLIMSGIILFFSPNVFTWFTIPLQVIVPTGVIIFIVVTAKAIKAKVDGAVYAGLGLFVAMFSVLLKVLEFTEIIPLMATLIVALDLGFTFMMSLILGTRFAVQFNKAETLQLETEQQHATIVEQKKEVDFAFEQLGEKNKEIIDSINYSKRIQDAILPPAALVKEHLPHSFVYYAPKDIVAGDFYWLESSDDLTLFAAADCTGHGVPGALLSMLCNNALNRSVREYELTLPGKILDKAREIVIGEFENYEEDVQDGMDISLCALRGMELQFAGAYNPLWIFRNGEIIETRGDKQPIGLCDDPKPFTTHTFTLEPGDSFYIFSDGYVDQFGGEKGKKFKSKAFKALLLSIQDKTMEEQHIIIKQEFDAWKGDLEQVDDVCVIGVKV